METEAGNKPRLIFHPSSAWLWQIMPEQVIVWDIITEQVRYSCDGVYVGMARDSSTFLTRSSVVQGHAWDAATGQQVPLTSLNPNDYDFHQRAVVFPREDVNKSTLEVVDLLGGYSPQLIDVGSRATKSYTHQEILEGWLLLPQRRLAVLLWAVWGFDYTQGKIYDLDSDQKLKTFVANNPGNDILLFDQLNLLVSAGMLEGEVRSLDAFSLEVMANPNNDDTGWRWYYTTEEGDASCISIHPQYDYEFAMVVRRIGFYDEIHLMEPAPQKPAYQQEVAQILPETGTVVALTHHKNGRQLAVLLSDGDIHLWDIEQGIRQQTLSRRPPEERLPKSIPNKHAIKKNWKRPKQHPLVIFHPTQPLMWHEKNKQVQAWDVATGDRRYTVPGLWVGRSQRGDSFLTLVAGDGRAWDSNSGAEIPLHNISAADYDLAQRMVFTGRRSVAAMYGWDLLGIEPAKTFKPNRRDYGLLNWGMDPSGRLVFLSLLGANEAAAVECHDWATGEYLFGCPRVAWAEDIYFSNKSDRLAACNYATYQVYDTILGKRLEEMSPSTWGHPFAFHPRQDWLCVFFTKNEIRWGFFEFKPIDANLPPTFPTPDKVVNLAFAADGEDVGAFAEIGRGSITGGRYGRVKAYITAVILLMVKAPFLISTYVILAGQCMIWRHS